MKIAIESIRIDGGTQPRAKIDEDTVAEYSDAMEGGAIFPPIVVFFDGSSYWLADGYHRHHAAEIAGIDEIEADVKQGTRRDAILYSVGVNASHGLRRTNEDKRRAVLRLLEDAEWSVWSDREIARRCAVSNNFVSSLRSSLSLDDSKRRTYTTKHGATATMDTSHIGRTTAPRPVVNESPIDHLAEAEPPPLADGPTGKPEAKHSNDERPFVEPTPADEAIADIKRYIDIVLDEIDTDMGRHYVVNTVLKYLRDKSVSLNQTA